MADIRRAVLAGRRAHRDEDDLGIAAGTGVGGEVEQAGTTGLGDDVVEAGLEHRADAPLQALDAGAIDIEATDLMTGVREAGGAYQSDVAAAHHGDFHGDLHIRMPGQSRPLP
jgi:hypothetical protein